MNWTCERELSVFKMEVEVSGAYTEAASWKVTARDEHHRSVGGHPGCWAVGKAEGKGRVWDPPLSVDPPQNQ